jgi:hypothetical protein
VSYCKPLPPGKNPIAFNKYYITFYGLRLETPPTWRTRPPYLYPPGTGWPGYTPRQWVLFSSPPMTRRATAEVFDPSFTRVWIHMSKSKSKLLYDWRFTASQFVLASSPLRPTTRDFFQVNLCGNSPYVTSSLRRRWGCLL